MLLLLHPEGDQGCDLITFSMDALSSVYMAASFIPSFLDMT
jgi:hypothetical protein